MSWLANPVFSGVGAIAGVISAITDVLPFFKRRNVPKNYATAVIEQFIHLFKLHGIERTQIPRFLGKSFSLKVADFSTDGKLLRVLDEKILDHVCNIFGVQRAWIDDATGQMYDLQMHYKDLPEFARFITNLTEKHPDEFCILYAYKPSKTSTDLFKSQPDISLVVAEPIAELDEKTIYRYYPLYGPFPWEHTEARFNLYAFFTLAFSTRGLVLKGHDVPSKFISKLAEGRVMPESIKAEGVWHPDDYALSSISHDMPMDSREIDGFWKYICDKCWLGLFDKNIITRPQ